MRNEEEKGEGYLLCMLVMLEIWSIASNKLKNYGGDDSILNLCK